MFKMVTKILGVIALTGWMGAANATLIFDFSWDSSNGKIIGEIYGLSDNGVNMEATGFVLTSIGGMQVNINVFEDDEWEVWNNSFDVLDGVIVEINFYSNTRVSEDRELYRGGRNAEALYLNDFYSGLVIQSSNNGKFVKRVTVPEPSSVILMLLGLAGLSFARYRKQY
jgi:hypothetical protein